MEGPMKLALLVGAVAGTVLQFPNGVWILVLLLAGWHLSAAVVALAKSELAFFATAATIDAAATFLVVPISRLGFTAQALPFGVGLLAAWLVSSGLRRLERRRSPALRKAVVERGKCSLGQMLRHSWLPRTGSGV